MTSTTSDIFGRRTVALLAAAAAGLALLGQAGPAPAAPPTPAAEAEASALIRTGEQHFVERRFEASLAAYREAYARTSAHGLLYMIARCHEELGQLEEAVDYFEKFLATSPPPEVRGQAVGALRLLRQRLGESRLVLQVAPFGATVLLDGEPVGVAPVPPRTVIPGWHEVEVRHPGFAAARERVHVPGGGEASVAVALTPLPEETAELRPWVWAGAGVAAALAVGGGVAWLLGESDHSEVAEGAGLTQREAFELAAEGDDKKLAGAVMWVGAGAAAATAVVLAVLDRPDEPRTEGSTSLGLAPLGTGAALHLSGSF